MVGLENSFYSKFRKRLILFIYRKRMTTTRQAQIRKHTFQRKHLYIIWRRRRRKKTIRKSLDRREKKNNKPDTTKHISSLTFLKCYETSFFHEQFSFFFFFESNILMITSSNRNEYDLKIKYYFIDFANT